MRAERVKGYTQLAECFLPHPNTVFFPLPAIHPHSQPQRGKRVVKIKSLSSNCSLPEEYSPKHLCWTISWGLAQTFGILHAGREKPQGTAFLKGPLSLSPALLTSCILHHWTLHTYGERCCPHMGRWQRILAVSFWKLLEGRLTPKHDSFRGLV